MLVLPASPSQARPAPIPLVIGLVNNMPPQAVQSTERQFCALLAASPRRFDVDVRLFSLTGSAHGSRADAYGGLPELLTSRLDGLVVTGARPTAPDMRDEPGWPLLARLIDHAREHVIPTVWSCLAAHAVALHMHGIARRPLPRKLSGLAECVRTESDHPLAACLPTRWRVPHSRYNELPEQELVAHGYEILSRSSEAGADIFIYERDTRFLFFHGHPEYEPTTLLREYHRDVGEYLSGKRQSYPDIPTNYLGPQAVASVELFRERAIKHRDPALLASFPFAQCEDGLGAPWHDVAVGVWTNWLAQLRPRSFEHAHEHLSRRGQLVAAK
jgi:homoserine O-succinyltransferase